MKKERLPPSFDSSPGAVPVQGSRESFGSGNLRSLTEPSQEQISLHEEECKEEVAAQESGTDVKIHGFSNLTVVNSSDAPKVCAVQDEENLPVGEPIYAEVHTPYTQDLKRWHERPMYRAIMIGGCLFALLLVVGIVLLVTLPRPTGETVTPSPTAIPTSFMTPQEIACEFIGRPYLVECLETTAFNSYDGGDSANGSTIPSEIGLLTKLVILSLYNSGLSGSIPSSISQLTLLQLLSFSNNKLTGIIPPSISSLTNLESLLLNNNALTGTIPSSIANLEQLETLKFYSNDLSGEHSILDFKIGRIVIFVFRFQLL